MTSERPSPVGELLAKELDARGWTQTQFAEILNRPVQVISEIVCGKKEITRVTATQISAALGPNPEHWLNHQHRHQLWRQAQDEGTRTRLDGHQGFGRLARTRDRRETPWYEHDLAGILPRVTYPW